MVSPKTPHVLKRFKITFKSLAVASALLAALAARAEDLSRRLILGDTIPQKDGNVKVAFFDADSTLRVSKSGSPSANGPDDYIILPGVAAKLSELNKSGFLVVIVSNQAGIPKFISFADANAALSNMIKDLAAKGARVDYYDFAELADNDRKPGTGMGERLEEILKNKGLKLDKANSLMVGDSAYIQANPKKGIQAETRPDGRPGFNFSNSDRLFAQNYGIAFKEPQDFFGWLEHGVEKIDKAADLAKFNDR